MNAACIVRIVAGAFILLSFGVEANLIFAGKYFLLFTFTAFVGLNLFQSGFSRFCLLNNILAKCGMRYSSC